MWQMSYVPGFIIRTSIRASVNNAIELVIIFLSDRVFVALPIKIQR